MCERLHFSRLPQTVLFLALMATAAQGAPCSETRGQAYIDEGRYIQALREFTCLVDAQPTEVAGYRGRIETELLMGRFSDAVRDYARVTAFVEPVHADARATIFGGYAARLAATPHDIPALSGASFAHWWYFDYPHAIQVLERLQEVAPDGLYGTLFLGSSRVLSSAKSSQGVADLERAIALAPSSADVRYIVSDGYTYGVPDANRALTEAGLALQWGLDTPRIRAILAASYQRLGNPAEAAEQIRIHLTQVTTQLPQTVPLEAGRQLTLEVAPGRTFEIPVAVTAGETLTVKTSSHDFYDTILVLLAPDGSAVVGSDDFVKYFAGLDWVAGSTGTYRLRVSSFEGVNTGTMTVTRR